MAKIQDIRHRTQRTNGTRSLSQIKYIVRHHSATPTGDFDSFWKYWHGTKGWGTGGYHEIILRDGTVQLCYDPNEITNGVGNYNTPTYHICLVGNGSFTAAQEKAWDERVAYNMKRLGIGVNNVKGHREMPGANTTCPGINMDTVRARIRGGAVTPNQPAPAPSKPSNPSKPKGKTISQMADEVIAGKHGQGHSARRKSLGISQAEYEKVRAEVNRRSRVSSAPKAKPKSKTVSQMAQEVIDGKHGNGHDA
ncbi:N-acetylmuramoyl-L-alanine amidase, partial [Oceanobacillus indicireducens]|uniref:N-acetylmuramoyl-L-alanine amidase n=1 Tax=Oceanobacillus indicireducens TaxID=1004261 RepID=UPI00166F079D